MNIESTLIDLLGDIFGFSRSLIEREIGSTDFASQMIRFLTPQQPRKKAAMAISGLPFLTYYACGGDPQNSIPLVSAWMFLHLAAKMFDDVEDEHPTDSSSRINVATGFLFASQLALLQLKNRGISLVSVYRLAKQFNQTSLKACSGQHRDVSNEPVQNQVDPQSWLSIAQEKSGELFGWAAWSGAKLAGSVPKICHNYQQFGVEFGVLLQIADDYNGIWHPDGISDLLLNRVTLPISYFWYVAKEEQRTRFGELIDLASKGQRKAEESARQLLIEVGAQKYCVATAWVYRQKAIAALSAANPDPEVKSFLVDLVNQTFPITVSAQILFNE